jgi:hypothetical protein
VPITLSAEVAIPAGGSVPNLLDGTRYLSLPNRRGAVRVFAVQDGATGGDVVINGSAGNSVQLDKAAVRTTAAGEGPDLDKHMVGVIAGQPFDPLVVEVLNNDAGNISNFRYTLIIAFG